MYILQAECLSCKSAESQFDLKFGWQNIAFYESFKQSIYTNCFCARHRWAHTCFEYRVLASLVYLLLP